MKRLLITLLTFTLLIGLASADAINTVRGFNYIDESGIVLGDNVPFYLGTGSISSGTLTADLKFLPDGTNIGITGAGNWNMGSATGAFILPTGTFTLTNGGTIAANKSLTWAAGSGGLDASSGAGTFKTSSGTNTLYGDVVVNGAKNLTVGTGATALGGTLDVDGDTTLDAVAIAETLDVDGNADLDLVNISETLDVDGNTDLDLVNISETLDVDGDTTVDGFTASEEATFSASVVFTPYVNNTANFTVGDSDYYSFHVGDSAGTQTITLPTVADNSGRFMLFVITEDPGDNNVVLDGEGSETVGGATTKTCTDAVGSFYYIYCDGLAWRTIGSSGTWS